jgi:hypothetical protein
VLVFGICSQTLYVFVDIFLTNFTSNPGDGFFNKTIKKKQDVLFQKAISIK